MFHETLPRPLRRRCRVLSVPLLTCHRWKFQERNKYHRETMGFLSMWGCPTRDRRQYAPVAAMLTPNWDGLSHRQLHRYAAPWFDRWRDPPQVGHGDPFPTPQPANSVFAWRPYDRRQIITFRIARGGHFPTIPRHGCRHLRFWKPRIPIADQRHFRRYDGRIREWCRCR